MPAQKLTDIIMHLISAMDMGLLWAIVGVSIAVCLLAYQVNRWLDRKYTINPDIRASYSSSQSTQELMVQVLKSMNCEMRPDEDNGGWYSVEYQGGRFSMSFNGEWVKMVHPCWYTVKLSDIDRLCAVRRVIDGINRSTKEHKVACTVDEERNEMSLHTMSYFFFTRASTDLVECLRFYFGTCFTIKHEFERRMAIEESKKQ